jgi:hypothetical protein
MNKATEMAIVCLLGIVTGFLLGTACTAGLYSNRQSRNASRLLDEYHAAMVIKAMADANLTLASNRMRYAESLTNHPPPAQPR